MNFLGVGALEIFIILAVAFLVLGPGKTITMVKSAGKMIGEVRRAMGDLTTAIEEEERQVNLGVPPDEPPKDGR